MPRVSEQYRADRRAEIVAVAARRFAEHGFHATSMADVINGSGFSAGSVYRYFRSKEELIGAVSETALTAAGEIFDRLLENGAAPSPADAVAAAIEGVVAKIQRDAIEGVDITRVALQVWAEAMRNPEVSERVNVVYRQFRGYCAEVARRWQAAGNLSVDADPVQVGAAILSLIQGFILQNLLITGTDAQSYLTGVRALLGATSPAEDTPIQAR